jgi:hypothetical protein
MRPLASGCHADLSRPVVSYRLSLNSTRFWIRALQRRIDRFVQQIRPHWIRNRAGRTSLRAPVTDIAKRYRQGRASGHGDTPMIKPGVGASMITRAAAVDPTHHRRVTVKTLGVSTMPGPAAVATAPK